jgi:hypothetical protein
MAIRLRLTVNVQKVLFMCGPRILDLCGRQEELQPACRAGGKTADPRAGLARADADSENRAWASSVARPRLSGRNICCVRATSVVLASILGGGPVCTLNAQEVHPIAGQPGAREAAPQPTAAPPSPDNTFAAYRLVEGWIRNWSVPDAVGADPGAAPAAAVTLRLGGVVTGRGTSVAPDGTSSALRAAAREAVDEADRRTPAGQDALRDAALIQDAARTTISLELSGALIPFEPKTYSEAAVVAAPGLEGVAVRIGDRVQAMFPGTMLSMGLGAGEAMAALVSKVSGEVTLGLKQPAELSKSHGAVFYRFRVSHVAQPAPGSAPIFLLRGGRLVERKEVEAAGLKELAAGLATNLQLRRWPGAERYGLVGTLLPTVGRCEPEFAGPVDQAIAALALLRYATMPGTNASVANPGRQFGIDLLHSIAVVESGEIDPASDPAAAGACVLALVEAGPKSLDTDPQLLGLLNMCIPTLLASVDAEHGFSEGVRDEARPLVCAGLAALARWCEQDEEADRARAAVRAVYRETPATQLVGRMPWLGWAERDLAGIEGPEAKIPAAVALREMRELVWKHQLTGADAGAEAPDLVGGIVFTSARNPLPTWQCARPLAFVATMLGDLRLTEPAETTPELGKLVGSLRFLRQLAADSAVCHMYQDRARGLWGVRAAVWDQHMPPDAESLTLLTVTETLRSLDAIGKRPRAKAEEKKK